MPTVSPINEPFLGELGFPQIKITPLHADNTSEIQIAASLVYHECTKNIKVDCHFIGKDLDNHVIYLPHISVQVQIA